MTTKLSFTEDHSFPVDVFHDELGKIGNATLAFGPGKAISLTFQGRTTAKLDTSKPYHRLVATTPEGRSYTLINCELNFGYIYADYILEGEAFNAFDFIEIEMTHITAWFFQWERIIGDVGQSIEWKYRPSKISANVTSPLGNFSLAISPYTDFTAGAERSEILNTALVSIEDSQSDLGVTDIRSIATSLCTLFSILLALPVSVLKIRVRGKNGKWHSIYFPHYEKVEDDERDRNDGMRYLLKLKILDDKSKWQIIAQSFFNSGLRDPNWIRLSSMKRYQDFWEYKVAAYVFILDSYVDFKTKSLQKKRSKSATNRVDEFNKQLLTVSNLNVRQRSSIAELATKIFGSTDHSFAERYQHVVSNVDQDVLKIINLANSDFAILKKFRDDLAHGKSISFGGASASIIPRLTEKLSLLLTYFAFLDFGLTSADFIECISHTWNRMVLNSDINHMHLSRMDKSAEFIPVSKSALDQIKQQTKNRIFCCFYLNPDADPTFSEYHTDLFNKQLNTQKPSGSSQDPNSIFQLKDRKVRTIGTLYFESGEDHLEFHHVFLFEPI
ncbi:hypothetical protein [Herbaspirillum sp. B39]|uniref:ApeA N-terminal domain 1-containing protein n=1 Tax=Herbaspirillum huttiense TaxID=863372 RepID=UPI0003485A81|nr:hypothetical protein [Herbaspirillum sp. B39]